jgi:hypothetical protein
MALQAYVDDSGGTEENKHPYFVLAGLIADAERWASLSDQWQAVLDLGPKLDYFKMSEASYLTKQFSLWRGWTKELRDRRVDNLVEIKHPLIGSAYSLCATNMLAAVQSCIAKRSGVDAAYFFEAGHQSQREANWIMEQIFNVPQLREDSGYKSHSFVDKRAFPGVQAADLLAWQFYTDIRRQMEGNPTLRADFASLRQHPHELIFLTPERLNEISMMPDMGSPEGNLLQIFLGTARATEILKLPRNAWKKTRTLRALGRQ